MGDQGDEVVEYAEAFANDYLAGLLPDGTRVKFVSDPLADLHATAEAMFSARPKPQPAIVTERDIAGMPAEELAKLEQGLRRMGFDGYVVV